MQPQSRTAPPFFHAWAGRDRHATSGQPNYCAGHRLDREEGVFAEWHWDGAELRLRSDRYGAYPLFYFERPGEICVSASLATLISEGAPSDPDYDAIAAFLRLGFFLAEDTPLRSVRVLPPDARFVWRDGVLRVSGDLTFARPAAYSRDDAIAAFVELFRAAIQRRVGGGRPVLLPLSGGRDSRHILLALVEAGAPPDRCVTVRLFPPRRHLEVPIAAAVARFARVPHVVIEQDAPRVEMELRKNLLTHFCSDEHAHFLALTQYVSTHAAVSYDGLAGDMLTGQSSAIDAALVELLEQDQFEAAAERLFESYDKRGIESALRGLLAPDFYARVDRWRAIARVTRELARHAAAPNRAMSFLFWNRTRRELALVPYAMMADLTVFTPYLDHTIVDLLMSLPPALLLDRRFHTDAIARAYPQARHLPYEEGESRTAPDMFFRRTAVELTRRLLTSPGPVERRYVLPRLAMAVATGRPAYLWFLPLAVYVSQLDAARRDAASAARP